MDGPNIRHDREVCDRCIELRLQEQMLPTQPRRTTLAGARMRWFHDRARLEAAARRFSRYLDPDTDRGMLWGEP